MNVREALEKVLQESTTTFPYRTSKILAPRIERALDELIDAMSAPHFCAMPQDVRDRWHGVFVAAMTEES